MLLCDVFLLTACIGCLQALLQLWLRNSTKADHARMTAILEPTLFDPDSSATSEESGAVENDFIEELEILLEEMYCLGYGGALGVEDQLCAVCDQILSRPALRFVWMHPDLGCIQDGVPWYSAPT